MNYKTSKSDIIFKELILNSNKPIYLKAILESIFNKKIDNITILNNEVNNGNIKSRRKRLDAIVEINNAYIGIEVNNKNRKYFRCRNFSYISNLYSNYIKAGGMYDESFLIIQINFTYNMKDSEYERIYTINDGTDKRFVKNFIIYEFNMNKIVNLWYTNDIKRKEKYKYLMMMNLGIDKLEILGKGDKVMEEYTVDLKKLNESRFWEYLTPEEDERITLNTIKKQSYDRGVSRGMKNGVIQGKTDTAREMLINNIPINLIEKCTGLSEKQINALK